MYFYVWINNLEMPNFASSSSSTSFYVVLPSNTQVEGNRSNSFRVRLPRKLQFQSQWSVGLAVLVYPHSWPSLGTTEQQFVRVQWQMGQQQQYLEVPVPAAHLKNPTELLSQVRTALKSASDELAQRLAQLHGVYKKAEATATNTAKEEVRREWAKSVVIPESDDGSNASGDTGGEMDERLWKSASIQRWYADVRAEHLNRALEAQLGKEELAWLEDARQLGVEAWIRAYAKPEECCRFSFDTDTQRFRLKLDTRYVRCVELSAQLAYILGFEQTRLSASVQEARYMPDMKGGVSSFYVYAPDLIEPVFIGDVAAPVLRVVNIRGAPDEMVEECYTAIQYHRLIAKELSEIFIEIRTASGALMPFQYGTCTLTLHFKKIPYF